MALKYIRHSVIGFVIWPERADIWHSDMAERLDLVRGEILSAGFASIHEDKVRCWGSSESLRMGGLPDDAQALAKQLELTAR